MRAWTRWTSSEWTMGAYRMVSDKIRHRVRRRRHLRYSFNRTNQTRRKSGGTIDRGEGRTKTVLGFVVGNVISGSTLFVANAFPNYSTLLYEAPFFSPYAWLPIDVAMGFVAFRYLAAPGASRLLYVASVATVISIAALLPTIRNKDDNVIEEQIETRRERRRKRRERRTMEEDG